jgi:pantoate--beta-alanine ligase
MQRQCDALRTKGKRIALVPTMGYLHEGHMALIREGRNRGDFLVVSIFVNPTQFGPREDFRAYPRDLKRDVESMRPERVDAVFYPDARQMYGKGYQTRVQLSALPKHLCGRSRPIHFTGVATVVAKLFNIIKPHTALFGEKDFQQLLVIRRMVKDLNFDVKIVGVPTVREADGLAMSSRNTYLNTAQRRAALSLFQSLEAAKKRVREGETDAVRIAEQAAARIQSHPEAVVDYIAVCDPETLEPVDKITKPVLMALAVKIGNTRLIDNMVLSVEKTAGPTPKS